MSSAIIGTGATVTHSALNVAHKLKGITVDGMQIGFSDGSVMGTTLWKDWLIHKLADAGSVTLEVEWKGHVPTIDGTAASMVITLSNSATLTCDAICTGFSGEIPLEEVMTASVTFKLTGEPTFA